VLELVPVLAAIARQDSPRMMAWSISGWRGCPQILHPLGIAFPYEILDNLTIQRRQRGGHPITFLPFDLPHTAES
jgi:hypothetical protein